MFVHIASRTTAFQCFTTDNILFLKEGKTVSPALHPSFLEAVRHIAPRSDPDRDIDRTSFISSVDPAGLDLGVCIET